MAIQTKEMICSRLNDNLRNWDPYLSENYGLERVAGESDVVIYFTPKELTSDFILSNRRKLPVLFVAIRTYTKDETGYETVGPRIEFGTRDLDRFSRVLEKTSTDWVYADSKLYANLEKVPQLGFKVMKGDEVMKTYRPEDFEPDCKATDLLWKNLLKAAKELRRVYPAKS
jgi:hypothetical protein